ncbi:SGNH/GDSL hydrolase family protein [Nocardia goodfellowii]
MRSATLLSAVALAATIATGPGPAQAETVDTGGRYVALGSSYAAGPGINPVVDADCGRSGANYPHQVAARLGMELIDVTCGGATTADVLSRAQRPGRATSARPPQIEAVTSETTLVTITIGGNDIGYVGYVGMASCLAKQVLANLPVDSAAAEQVCSLTARKLTEPTAGDYDKVRDSIAEIVTQVRARAPRATVALVQYLPVFGPQVKTCGAVPMAAEQAAGAARVYSGLAAATADAAARTGAVLVSTVAAAADHSACSTDPWLTGFALPGIGAPAYHPTAAGMTGLAELVVGRL